MIQNFAEYFGSNKSPLALGSLPMLRIASALRRAKTVNPRVFQRLAAVKFSTSSDFTDPIEDPDRLGFPTWEEAQRDSLG
eukprot:1393667-Amorphochlora_amoeboformis.AAC.2